MSTISTFTQTDSNTSIVANLNANFSALNTDKYESANFVDTETPTGTINASNVTFTLANTPIAGTVKVWVDGVRLSSADYSVSGTTLTLGVAPSSQLVVDYRK